MTLGEAKNRVYMLLDEHSNGGEIEHDPDLEKKMTAFFDTAQKLLSQRQRIVRTRPVTVVPGRTEYPLPEDFRTLRRVWRNGKLVTGRCHVRRGRLIVPEGERETLTVEYFAAPATIPENAPDDTVFELSEEACACMPYYVAAQHLLTDMVLDYRPMLEMFERMAAELEDGASAEPPRLLQQLYR